jgi:adenylate kinase family enzyme/ADP-ribose pyrophosphatase YjhB (NUDIX family)
MNDTRFYLTPQQPQGIPPSVEKCIVYVEQGNRLMTLPGRHDSWDLPSGTIGRQERQIEACQRIILEQTQLNVQIGDIRHRGQLYGQGAGVVSVIHFYSVRLLQLPVVPNAEWISIFAYRYLHLIHKNRLDMDAAPPQDGRLEAFDLVYRDRIWRPLPRQPQGGAASGSSASSSSGVPLQAAAHLVLKKGDKQLEFNDRRLMISLIGPAAAGKKTQAQLLGRAFGLPHTSTREMFQGEDDGLRKLVGLFGDNFSNVPLPEAIPNGMMVKWLSHPETRSGAILRGFPSTEEQCRSFSQTFTRPHDVVASFYLQMADHQRLLERVDREAREDAAGRTQQLLRNIDQIAQSLQCSNLQLSVDTPIEEVFHRLFERIEAKLDAQYDSDHPPQMVPVQPPPQQLRMNDRPGDQQAGYQQRGRDVERGAPSRPLVGEGDERQPLIRRQEESDEEGGCCCCIQ